jgi:hypothetical protein
LCHPPTEDGLLITDINGGWYAHVRTQDHERPGGQTSHYQASDVGIVYEMNDRLGVCDPATYRRREYFISTYPVIHVGRDQEARAWFFDSKRIDPETGTYKNQPRCICYLPELKAEHLNEPQLIMSGTRPYGEGQHAHLHPVIMPDRKNILFVIGDDRWQTNHLCLLDISDLPETVREA